MEGRVLPNGRRGEKGGFRRKTASYLGRRDNVALEGPAIWENSAKWTEFGPRPKCGKMRLPGKDFAVSAF